MSSMWRSRPRAAANSHAKGRLRGSESRSGRASALTRGDPKARVARAAQTALSTPPLTATTAPPHRSSSPTWRLIAATICSMIRCGSRSTSAGWSSITSTPCGGELVGIARAEPSGSLRSPGRRAPCRRGEAAKRHPDDRPVRGRHGAGPARPTSPNRPPLCNFPLSGYVKSLSFFEEVLMSLFSPGRLRLGVLGVTVALLAHWPAGPLAAQLPYTIDTLPNGLRLIIHQDASVPTVSVNVWYHVGSGDERVGRTGFAHLFEHLMFMGSEHAPYPAFDRMLEAAGANNNGSTTEDRTNYYEEGPSNSLPLMLWLEADRMGFFLSTMDSAKLDLQRDVVKNERRQRVDNQPYGRANETIQRMLYPASHPYSWPTIGSMADLSAASVEDTKEFFRKYYAPNNASLVVAGDVRTDEVRAL